jgi:N-acetylglucosaminyldiphosphoundecaprenol N-acetyl-beta-D-mannosaminyltransferase
MEKNNLFGMHVNIGKYNEYADEVIVRALANESDYACVANVHMLIETYRNSSFANTVNEASVIAPDGKPITWALRFLHGIKQERVAGMELLPDLLKLAEEKRVPVFFYGGSEEMMAKAEPELKKKFRDLQIAGTYSPPFRQLTTEEEAAVVDRINQSGAKLVFVILGCPKQEKWMAAMKGRVQAFMIGVGGALPVLLGMQKRAPKWMQKAGLEWLHRLSQEPGRLFKRYAVTNSLFLYLFFKAYLRKKILYPAS